MQRIYVLYDLRQIRFDTAQFCYWQYQMTNAYA